MNGFDDIKGIGKEKDIVNTSNAFEKFIEMIEHFRSNTDELDEKYADKKLENIEYNVEDLKTILKLYEGRYNNEGEKHDLGAVVGTFLTALTKKNRAKGEKTRLEFDKKTDVKSLSISCLKEIDELIIRNYKGESDFVCNLVSNESLFAYDQKTQKKRDIDTVAVIDSCWDRLAGSGSGLTFDEKINIKNLVYIDNKAEYMLGMLDGKADLLIMRGNASKDEYWHSTSKFNANTIILLNSGSQMIFEMIKRKEIANTILDEASYNLYFDKGKIESLENINYIDELHDKSINDPARKRVLELAQSIDKEDNVQMLSQIEKIRKELEGLK